MNVRSAVALALLLACSRGPKVHHPFERPPSHVGDRSEMVIGVEGRARVDGKEFEERRTSKRRNEILTMQGVRITSIRVEVLEQSSIVNGVAEPAILGAFLVEERGGKLEITKPDGTTPTDRERAYIHAVSEQTFKAPLGTTHRGYEIGKPERLSSEEAASFGLGSRASAEFTLTEVRDPEFVVRVVGSEAPTGSGASQQLGKRWDGEIKISRQGPRTEHWRMQIELFDEHGVVGHESQELEYHLIPRAEPAP